MPGIEHDTALTLLERRAREHGDRTLLRIDGQELTYRQVFDSVTATAAGLRALGVQPGDRVAVMADNRQEAVWAWLGANAASAVDVPLNTAALGHFLEAQLASAEPRAVIGTADYLARIAALAPPGVEIVVSMGKGVDPAVFPAEVRHVTFEELLALGRSASASFPQPIASALATLLYTSGTTGPSKGVMIPQRYYPIWGRRGVAFLDVRDEEVVYSVQPLFHVDSRAYLLGAMTAGATFAVGTRFSVSSFWNEVREHRANVFSYIGTMLWLLHKQQPSERDRDHHVRVAGGAATPAEIHADFEERFGIQLREAYGMTESLFLAHAGDSTPPGSVGRMVPEVEGQLFDEFDQPVPAGESGELCFRPVDSFATAQGYWGMPQETADATRNLWFHTGDLLREDEEGNLIFVGRKKDSIRRRGENVSAWEVEQAVMRHPDVLEAAVIGVPSPLGEEDVALLARLRDGASLAPSALRDFLVGDLPKFALPRYVELVESFPKTPSERVDKGKVKAAGLSSSAWDAESPAV